MIPMFRRTPTSLPRRLPGSKLCSKGIHRSQTRFTSQQQTPQSRIDRMTSRLPRFLRRYTNRLRSAPLTHVTAFLLLHELTAVVPLLGLAGAFHYFQWLPPYISEWKYASDGLEKFGKYFRRKGWLGADAEIDADGTVRSSRRVKVWGWGEGGVKVIVELATAYAVTKVLLPVRLAVSVGATPWFARVAVVPCLGLVKRVFGRTASKAAGGTAAARGLSPAGGTNAIGGGVVGR